MKLRTKLIISFTCVIGLLLIIGGTSQYFNNQIKNKVIDENREAVKELEASGQLEAYLYQSLVNTQYYLDEPFRATLNERQRESALSIDKMRSNVRASMQGVNDNLQQIDDRFNDDNFSELHPEGARDSSMVILDKLKTRVNIYNSLIQQSLSYEQGNYQDGKEFLVVTVEPFFRNNLLPLVEEFRSQIRTNLDREVEMLNNRLNSYSNIILFATLIAFLFSIILAYLLYKSITIPIKSLADASQEIGRGNLEKRIAVKTNDEIGQLGSSFNRMAENLNETTFSKEYVDNIIESMGDALIVTDDKARIKKVNSATTTLLGYSSSELIGEPLSLILLEKEKFISLNERESMEHYETKLVRKDSHPLPVNLSIAIIKDSEEKVQGLVCVANNITERKKAEQVIKKSLKEKEILLAEIHHRVKNNLAVISGLLQMQAWEADNETAREVLQDSQMRVKSIALVHEKLYQSDNLSSIAFEKYVHELLSGIEKTYKDEHKNVSFNTDIDPVIFNINQAIPCSLLLNELIVNAYKHAFEGKNEGRIMVSLDEADGMIELHVQDNGVGLDNGSVAGEKSLGMALVNTLVQQLDGEMETASNGGASFKITFELEEVV